MTTSSHKTRLEKANWRTGATDCFFAQHMEPGELELYQQYLLQLVAMFITWVLQQSVKFSCPSYIPPGHFVLTIDYLSLISMAISSAKGESNVKAFEWSNLSSTFTSHHCSLHPPVIFYAVLHGKVNLQWTGLLTKALLHTFWYYSRLEDTFISFPFYLAFPRGLSFLNFLPLVPLSPRFSVIIPYPSQNTVPKTTSAFPPILSWAENVFLCLKGHTAAHAPCEEISLPELVGDPSVIHAMIIPAWV